MPGFLSAQTVVRDTVGRDTTQRVVHKTLFTREDAWIGAGFAAATIAMFPLDQHIAQRLQNPSAQANRAADRAASTFEWFGSTGGLIIGSGIYVAGWVTHAPDVRDAGWHGLESAIVAAGVTGLLKGTLGRARPFVSNDTNAHDFRFGGGFTNEARTSFPSGHTTVSFAAAAALTSEAQRHWPDRWWSTWLVGPVLYGGAGMVGLARMYHNKHWASDVALGAAIGTFSGRKVVEYSHEHPDNPIDRVMLHLSVGPGEGGGTRVALVYPW